MQEEELEQALEVVNDNAPPCGRLPGLPDGHRSLHLLGLLLRRHRARQLTR